MDKGGQMRAIDYIEQAFRTMSLDCGFAKIEQEILREDTVAQVSYVSRRLNLMLKLFVSEMEGEGGIYLASRNTPLGYREKPSWISPWVLKQKLIGKLGYDETALVNLRRIPPLKANCCVQLRHELDWFAANLNLIVSYFNREICSS